MSSSDIFAGSLDSEAGIYSMTFDQSYSRLLTAEADKTIKIYREDPNSVSLKEGGVRGSISGANLSLY